MSRPPQGARALSGAVFSTRWLLATSWAIAALTAVIAAYFAVRYRAQPLLEAHWFRQTQTALTAYWAGIDGPRLRYETPVAGAPWSIPFELPLYQWLVALLHAVSDVSLGAVGRLVSFAALIGCAWPARRIFRLLGLSALTLPVFLAFLFSSPLYLLWGRAFLYETFGLLLTAWGVAFALAMIRDRDAKRISWPAAVFFSLAAVQAWATAVPAIIVLAACWLRARRAAGFSRISSNEWEQSLGVFVAPLVIGVIWISFADGVKAANALGAQMTSGHLMEWTYGTIGQRLSTAFWYEIGWTRVLVRNAGGLLGVGLLVGTIFFTRAAPRRAALTGGAVALVSVLTFSNLHLLHEFAQSGFVAFVLAALAITAVALAQRTGSAADLLAVIAVMLGSNYSEFSSNAARVIRREFDATNTRTLAVADVLRAHTAADVPVVIFGNDWCSDIAFYSQRRTFTVPEFFSRYDEVLAHPESFVGGEPALVVCPSSRAPGSEWLQARIAAMPHPRVTKVHECTVAVPNGTADAPFAVIDFREGGNSSQYAVTGFGRPEAEHSWTVGGGAFVTMPSTDTGEPVILHLRAGVYLGDGALPAQRVVVLANGTQVAEWRATVSDVTEHGIVVPAHLQGNGELLIELRTPDARSPQELGRGGDQRRLGLNVRSLIVE